MKTIMADGEKKIPAIEACYGTLPSMLRKFDRYARKGFFKGSTVSDFMDWSVKTRSLLRELLGLDKMEMCPLKASVKEITMLPDGIRREYLHIQVEPDVWMPVYILIPENAGKNVRPFLCPPGHNGAGRYTVAGLSEYSMVAEKIKQYNYDYGYQLAKLGYAAVCPDCRGFGERREDKSDAENILTALKGDCYYLSHMAEPLGITVTGMLTWDLMRAADYIAERGEWDTDNISCLGFSGGGMQTLWLSALDERISLAVISGYMYGFRDALLKLNRNCSCNYIPHLWEHLDMGDIACLIAPRPLLIQSCRDDRLNGERGIINAVEQVDIVKNVYRIMEASDCIIHDIHDGGHQWHGEKLNAHLEHLIKCYNQLKK